MVNRASSSGLGVTIATLAALGVAGGLSVAAGAPGPSARVTRRAPLTRRR